MSGAAWAVPPLTGLLVPFVPQLMRMVLNESLKALKTRGWEERSVSQRVLTLLMGESGFVSLGVGFTCFFIICHKAMSAFPRKGDDSA